MYMYIYSTKTMRHISHTSLMMKTADASVAEAYYCSDVYTQALTQLTGKAKFVQHGTNESRTVAERT